VKAMSLSKKYNNSKVKIKVSGRLEKRTPMNKKTIYTTQR